MHALSAEVSQSDPSTKVALESAKKDLEVLLPRAVTAAKDLVKDPANSAMQDELACANAALLVPLSEVDAAIRPSTYTKTIVTDHVIDSSSLAVVAAAKQANIKTLKV